MEPNGIVIGIVTNLEDPEKLGRVKVAYPHLDSEESDWARLATLMAGKNRGSFFRPEVGDEVLVAFLQGNNRYPFVIGSLWNGVDTPPPDGGKAKENNWRFIKSRSGHTLKFDDTKDKEQVEIKTKQGHTLLLDDTKDKNNIKWTSTSGHTLHFYDVKDKTFVQLETTGGHTLRLDDLKDKGFAELKTKSGHRVKLNDAKGKETIEIVDKDAKRKIVIDCAKKKLQIICNEGDVEVKVPNGAFKVDAKTIEMKAKTAVKVEAGSSMELKAKAALQAQAQAIEAKAQATMKLQASTTMDVQASGPVTVKGAIINLN